MSDPQVQGSCLCQTVRYRLSGPILNFQYCHCSRCRKFTGSGHAANLFVAVGGLHWEDGEDQVGTFDLRSEPGFLTAFCKVCGSSMPNMSSTGRYWVIPAGSLDEDPAARPRRSIYWDSRASWFVDTGDLPRHAELPPEGG